MREMKRSKCFKHKLGHEAFSTPTVAELIEFLSQHPPDMPVIATWEGTMRRIGDAEIQKDFYVGAPKDVCEVLVFDVEF